VSTDVTIERYDASERDRWDAVVRGARARHFMFERDYMDYHADRFADASWFVLAQGRPIAVLPVSRHGDEAVSHGGLTFGGLIAAPELTTARAVEALARIVEGLRGDGVRRLVCKPMPHIYHLSAAEEDQYALVAAGAQIARREVTSAIAPGPRPGYVDERRRGIRKAGAHGLELTETGSFGAYWALLRDVLRERHGVEPVHSQDEIELLARRFPGRIRLIDARERDEVVAGTLVFQTETVAHAQYIASGARGRETSALDALFDHLVREVFADVWFDFGISNERDGSLNEGLVRNKEGYGARAIVHDRLVLEL
jgi:hypothetical protein